MAVTSSLMLYPQLMDVNHRKNYIKSGHSWLAIFTSRLETQKMGDKERSDSYVVGLPSAVVCFKYEKHSHRIVKQ